MWGICTKGGCLWEYWSCKKSVWHGTVTNGRASNGKVSVFSQKTKFSLVCQRMCFVLLCQRTISLFSLVSVAHLLIQNEVCLWMGFTCQLSRKTAFICLWVNRIIGYIWTEAYNASGWQVAMWSLTTGCHVAILDNYLKDNFEDST